MCYDTFLGKTKAPNSQTCSSYKELEKTLIERGNIFSEGKVSRTYFNQLCSTYDGSTDENGEILKCSICLDELEIGAEVCRLPCGHLNCKTCIEEWFDIRTENSDISPYQTSVEESYETSDEEDNETSDEEDNETSDEEDNEISVEEDNGTSVEEDNETSVEEDNGTSDEEDNETSVEEDNGTSVEEDNGTSVEEDNEITIENNTYIKRVTFNDDYDTSELDEDKYSDEDPNFESDVETLGEDEVSQATCLEKDDKTPDDVYWNEYVIIEEDQKQEARNQCPLCKHICS